MNRHSAPVKTTADFFRMTQVNTRCPSEKSFSNKKENSIMASQPILGCIYMFAGNFAPAGYQLCQGQVLSIAQNTALFSILGTTYGGNGVSTFALPDLRGRAPIGQGSGPGLSPITLGEASGVQNVTLLASNMPAHNHLVNVSTAAAAQTSPKNNFLAPIIDSTPAPGTAYNTAATSGSTLAPTAVSIAGQGLPLSIQNPYLGISYIIAMVGIFPSRN
jgi:microcystin-dependent protein